MFRENHRLVRGRLKEEYLKAIAKRQAPLDQAQKEAVAQAAYARIDVRGIWTPYHEVRGYLSRKLPDWNRKYLPAGGVLCSK